MYKNHPQTFHKLKQSIRAEVMETAGKTITLLVKAPEDFILFEIFSLLLKKKRNACSFRPENMPAVWVGKYAGNLRLELANSDRGKNAGKFEQKNNALKLAIASELSGLYNMK